MAERPEPNDPEISMTPRMPTWATSMRVTKEQLEAAERTRAYHLRQLQRQITSGERSNDSGARSEH
jgi:hypothetical protein